MAIKNQNKVYTREKYVEFLNSIGGSEYDLKSNGGRIPDSANYGKWIRRNDPIAFNTGFQEWVRR